MKILKTEKTETNWTLHKFYLGHYAKALRVADYIANLPERSGNQLADYWWDATDFLRIVKANNVCRAGRWDYREFLALRRFFNSITLIEKR